ncbi:unnamed protein product [Orchesella dallaii]|uniref:Uncharacterized protein n=1 Tax=Orchesella dallaii TaxID=48710 RepID=A0ABP1Q9D8_9HEXA
MHCHHPLHHHHHHQFYQHCQGTYSLQDGKVLSEQTKLEASELIDSGGGGGIVEKESSSSNSAAQTQHSSCHCACSRPVSCLKQDNRTDDDSPCSYERGNVVMCDLVLANARTRLDTHGGRTLQQRRERDHSLDSYATTGRKGILTWKPRRGQSEGDLSVDPSPPFPLPPPPPPPLAKRRSFNQQAPKSPSPYYDCDRFSCPYGKELRCLCPPTPCCEVHGLPVYSPPCQSSAPEALPKYHTHSGTLPRSQQQSSQPQGILRNSNLSQKQQQSASVPPQCSDSFYEGGRQRLSMPSEFYNPLPLCQCEDFYKSLPPIPPPIPPDINELRPHYRTNSDSFSSAVRLAHPDNHGPPAISSCNRITGCEPYLNPPENYQNVDNQPKSDIQEFYELTLLDDTKSVQEKTAETIRIATKWEGSDGPIGILNSMQLQVVMKRFKPAAITILSCIRIHDIGYLMLYKNSILRMLY